MNSDDFFAKTEIIIDAYKGFKIFKNGSKCDKIKLIVILILFAVSSVTLAVTNNFILWCVCFALWIASVIAAYAYQRHILKRETKVYVKRAPEKLNFLHFFEQKLSKHGINRKDYALYIDFFQNALNFDKVLQTNELGTYLSIIVCPILLSFVTKKKEFESLLLSVIGILVIPGLIFCINWFIHRKIYAYNGVIYYLNLGLQLENYNSSLTDIEV